MTIRFYARFRQVQFVRMLKKKYDGSAWDPIEIRSIRQSQGRQTHEVSNVQESPLEFSTYLCSTSRRYQPGIGARTDLPHEPCRLQLLRSKPRRYDISNT